MKFIIGTPNKQQMNYIKLIQKLDPPNIMADSITVKVPDLQDLEEIYNKKRTSASNNFELTQITREFESRKIVSDHLVQIQFQHRGFRFPFYFETIPEPIPTGTTIEGTFNTIINKVVEPIFIGRTLLNKMKHILVTPSIKIDSNLFEETFYIDDYLRGKFAIALLLAFLRKDIGSKILTAEGSKEELGPDKLLERLNADPTIQKYLQKLRYLAYNKVQPVDLPKSVCLFGHIDAECMGCVVPVTEDHILFQIGDYNPINKSVSYPLFISLVSIILQDI